MGFELEGWFGARLFNIGEAALSFVKKIDFDMLPAVGESVLNMCKELDVVDKIGVIEWREAIFQSWGYDAACGRTRLDGYRLAGLDSRLETSRCRCVEV